MVHVQYLIPDCYIFRFVFGIKKKVRLKTLLNPEIFPDCYTFLDIFFVIVRESVLYLKYFVLIAIYIHFVNLSYKGVTI